MLQTGQGIFAPGEIQEEQGLKKENVILPRYAFLPILISMGLNSLVYSGSRFLTSNLRHYDFSLPVDKAIPFVPAMMLIYVLAYVMWAVGFVVIGRESRQVCYEVLAGEQIAKLICLLCFFIIPSTLKRPEITGTTLWDNLTKLIYALDAPDNLFPSIHCLESWVCFRGAMRCNKAGGACKAGMFVAAVLVFASTLLVKQHVFVDVIGGVAAVEAGLYLSGKFNAARVYYRMERRLGRHIDKK